MINWIDLSRMSGMDTIRTQKNWSQLRDLSLKPSQDGSIHVTKPSLCLEIQTTLRGDTVKSYKTNFMTLHRFLHREGIDIRNLNREHCLAVAEAAKSLALSPENYLA